MTIWTNALTLFHPDRLDLVVKFRFFRSLISGADLALNERLYRWHIEKRTSGTEPADFRGMPSTKHSVDAYVDGCRTLLTSMQENGFDAACAVPIGIDGRPWNGAHRIAAAAALGIQVAVEEVDKPGVPWGFQWFQQAGMTPTDLSRLLHTWTETRLQHASIFVLWGPVLARWDAMIEEIKRKYQMVGYIDLAFGSIEREAFSSLIYDLYAFEAQEIEQAIAHISRKVDFLLECPLFLRTVVVCEPSGSPGPMSAEVKLALRELCHSTVDSKKFVTCHATSTDFETAYTANVLLSPINIDHVRLRTLPRPRPQFLAWLDELRKKLLALQIDSTRICIVGSGALEGVGIRTSTDIDITLDKALRHSMFDGGITHVANQLDVVTEGYHRRADGHQISDDTLISSPEAHYICLGFKAAAVRIVYDRKAFSARPKDLLDVQIIERHPQYAALVQIAPVKADLGGVPHQKAFGIRALWNNHLRRRS